jgi:hypothetical protein
VASVVPQVVAPEWLFLTGALQVSAGSNPTPGSIYVADVVPVEYPANSYGVLVTAKTPAARLVQGQSATLEWVVRDGSGNPVNLSPYVAAGGVFTMRACEALSIGVVGPTLLPTTVIDAPSGLVHAAISAHFTILPGVYVAQCAIEVPAGSMVRTYEIYLIVERGLFAPVDQGGPPTIAEIRTRLRDSAPDENDLIDKVEFDLTEIATSIIRPVQYWNETPPPISTYTTATFTERYHWLDGICSNLLKISAAWYRRNRLLYSAGGTTVDDRNKEKEYTEAGMMLWQEYQTWVQTRKISINAQMFTGSFGSAYRYPIGYGY